MMIDIPCKIKQFFIYNEKNAPLFHGKRPKSCISLTAERARQPFL